jgi:hypothetical protein
MERRLSNSSRPARRRCLVLALLALTVVLGSGAAEARPNTHAPAISTWDTRASNIMFGYHRALFGTASSNILSYSANFASTSGVLLAQFGLHYVSYRRRDDEPIARGVSAGGVALFNFALSERYSNGVPPSAFAFYVGGVPTALISGRLNYLSVPAVLGIGVPLSPSPSVTLVPWVELSPGLNFDTRINEISTDDAIEAARDGTLTESEVENLVRQGLDAELKTSLGARAGLSAAFHLGERVDFNADLMIGGSAVALGGGLVIRWDELVPGVRPPGSFTCADFDARARACGGRRRLPERQPGEQPPVAPVQPAVRRTSPLTTPGQRAPAARQRNARPGASALPSGSRPGATGTGARPPPRRQPPPRTRPKPTPVAPPPGPATTPTPSPSDAFPPLRAAPP